MGHQLVNPDWNKLRPTNPVKRSQYGLCTAANSALAITKAPAISRSARSTVIPLPLSFCRVTAYFKYSFGGLRR